MMFTQNELYLLGEPFAWYGPFRASQAGGIWRLFWERGRHAGQLAFIVADGRVWGADGALSPFAPDQFVTEDQARAMDAAALASGRTQT